MLERLASIRSGMGENMKYISNAKYGEFPYKSEITVDSFFAKGIAITLNSLNGS